MNLPRLALRNVARNRRRTLVTLAAMTIAAAMMIFYAAMMAGMVDGMIRNATLTDMGEAQAHAPGYRKDPDIYTRIADPEALIARLAAAGMKATPRLYAYGLAAHGNASSGVELRGTDPVREARVILIAGSLAKGRWLDAADDHGAVIGRKVARSLGVAVGDEIVVVSQAADGASADDLFTVRGILKSVSARADASGVYIPAATFRELLAVPTGAHEIAMVRVDPLVALDTLEPGLRAAAGDAEVRTWRELSPVLAQLLDSMSAALAFMLLIAYAAVAMVVLNAMLMTVFERIREFGIMKALGVTPRQVFALVVLETLIQTAIASVFAVILGVGLSWHYRDPGLDLSGLMDATTISGVAMSPLWPARLSAEAVLQPVVLLFVMAVLAVIYPGLKAALIRPVQAIYHR